MKIELQVDIFPLDKQYLGEENPNGMYFCGSKCFLVKNLQESISIVVLLNEDLHKLIYQSIVCRRSCAVEGQFPDSPNTSLALNHEECSSSFDLSRRSSVL